MKEQQAPPGCVAAVWEQVCCKTSLNWAKDAGNKALGWLERLAEPKLATAQLAGRMVDCIQNTKSGWCPAEASKDADWARNSSKQTLWSHITLLPCHHGH